MAGREEPTEVKEGRKEEEEFSHLLPNLQNLVIPTEGQGGEGGEEAERERERERCGNHIPKQAFLRCFCRRQSLLPGRATHGVGGGWGGGQQQGEEEEGGGAEGRERGDREPESHILFYTKKCPPSLSVCCSTSGAQRTSYAMPPRTLQLRQHPPTPSTFPPPLFL